MRIHFLLEWLDLALRWAHVFAGILWVGTTYYFTWVGRRLGEEVAGVSIVHGGAFYTVRKQTDPPEQLHWFRWEALITWLTGVALLWMVYYLRGRGGGVGGLTRPAAFGVALSVLVFAWIVYDLLWLSPLARFETPLVALCYLILVALSYALMQVFNGRAAYIHVGALMGTLMTANVWLRIVPAYRRILESVRGGGPLDETLV
ncbi:MAG TPA: urate hydroxylase PuuD, partial [Myxococcales bacterium]|nr:urate hydroxylase PuuD [Myxococcales bacterium]